MQISSSSNAYGGGEAQRLLAALMSQQISTGQDSPSDDQAQGVSGPPSGPPPGPPPGGGPSSQFAGDTLTSLLDAQSQKPSASDMAAKLISALDSNGDGSVSLDEITKALSGDGTAATSTSSSSNPLSDAFNKLDTKGDGKLSSDELASGLQAMHSHRHGHHGHHVQAQDETQAQTASAADTTSVTDTTTTSVTA
jgi:Ca2+-binding EF-hand superfamily protein